MGGHEEGRKEGRKERSGAKQGLELPTLTFPLLSSGTTDSVSPPPPGMMFYESRQVGKGSCLLSWHGRRSLRTLSHCPSLLWVPPQPPALLPLSEPSTPRWARYPCARGKTHLPQATPMDTEDQAHTCPFPRAAPRSPRVLQLLLQAGWFYFRGYFDPTRFSSVPGRTAQAMQYPPLQQGLQGCSQAPNHPRSSPLHHRVKINSS